MNVTWEFEVCAGALVRRSILHQFKVQASKVGLSFEVVSDDGGWVDTRYLIRVGGPGEIVKRYAEAVRRWNAKQKENGNG